jgi:hypothetical protein
LDPRTLARIYIHYDNVAVNAWEILFPFLGQIYMAHWLQRHGLGRLYPAEPILKRKEDRKAMFLYMCSRAYRFNQELDDYAEGANLRELIGDAAEYPTFINTAPRRESDPAVPEMNLPPTPPDLDGEIHGMATPPTPPILAARLFQEAPSPIPPLPEHGDRESVSFLQMCRQAYQSHARPAHHPENTAMRELREFIDRTLPVEDQQVPAPIPLSPDVHLCMPSVPTSPSTSRSTPPSR